MMSFSLTALLMVQIVMAGKIMDVTCRMGDSKENEKLELEKGIAELRRRETREKFKCQLTGYEVEAMEVMTGLSAHRCQILLKIRKKNQLLPETVERKTLQFVTSSCTLLQRSQRDTNRSRKSCKFFFFLSIY